MKKVRTPIQIAVLRFSKPCGESGEQNSIETEVVALCDDGSIWTILGTDNEWVPLPPIPQDQLRDDWLREVGELLVSDHLVRPEAVNWVLSEYRDELRLAFNSHDSTKDAAKAIRTKLEAKR